MGILSDLIVKVAADVKGFKEAMGSVTGGLDAVGKATKLTDAELAKLSKGTQDAVNRQQTLTDRLQTQLKTQEDVRRALAAGQVSQQVYARATADVERAMAKANPQLSQHVDMLNRVRFAGIGLGDALSGGLKFAGIAAAVYEAGKFVFHAGEVFEGARIKIERETGATGQALAGLQQSFRNLYAGSTQSGDVVAAALSQVAVRTGATGALAEALTRQQLQFAKVTGSDPSIIKENLKLFEQFNVAAEDQGVALDILNVARQKSGISAQQLVSSMLSAGPALQGLRFNFEDTAAMVANFDRAGLDATEMTQGLQRAFAKWAAANEDPRKMLDGLLERMSHAKTRMEAARMAIAEGFSPKSVEKFADAVLKGAFNLGEMKKALDGSGGSVKTLSDNTETLWGNLTKLFHTMEANAQASGFNEWLNDLVGKYVETLDKMREISSKHGYLALLTGPSGVPPADQLGATTDARRRASASGSSVPKGGAATAPGTSKPSDIGKVEAPSTQAELNAQAITEFQVKTEELRRKLNAGQIEFEGWLSGMRKASDELREAAGAAGQLDAFLATQQATEVGLNAEFKGSAILLEQLGTLWLKGGQDAAEYGAALQIVLSATAKLRAEEERKRVAADSAFAEKASRSGVTIEEARAAAERLRSSRQTGTEFLQSQLRQSGVKLPGQVMADLLGRQGTEDAAQQRQAEAQLGAQLRQMQESQRQKDTGLLGEFGAGGARGVEKLINDFGELNEAYRMGRVSLQELTEAQSEFFSKMEEEAEKPALRQAIKMFEQGMIGEDELLRARNRARAGEARRGVEDAFLSGRASAVDLLNAAGQYRYDVNANRPSPRVPSMLNLPGGMQIPDISLPRVPAMASPNAVPISVFGGSAGPIASALPPIQVQLILDGHQIAEHTIRNLKDRMGVTA